MAEKAFQFVSQAKPVANQEPVDWSKCCLCQEDTTERLQDPTNYKGSSPFSGYATLSRNVLQFKEIKSLPMKLKSGLFEDDTISLEDLLSSNKAKWHKSCYLKFKTTKLKRAEKRSLSLDNSSSEDTEEVQTKHTRQSLPCKVSMKANICFFCDKPLTDIKAERRESATRNIDFRVRDCAKTLQDTALLAKLSAGDLVAQEAKYHPKCLVSLYNRAERAEEARNNSVSSRHEKMCHAIALADIVSYIEDTRYGQSVRPVFKMPDIVSMYSDRLKQLGIDDISTTIHSTKLKDKILANIPDLKDYRDGRITLLAFKEDVGPALNKACVDTDLDSNFIHIHKVARLIRKDLLDMSTKFSGSFPDDCQETAVPQSLRTLVNMLLYGTELTSDAYSQPALSLSQLIMFNCINRSKESSKSLYHSKSRETPLPVYLGMMVHCQTRKRDLVDKLFHLGLSVSYDRVLAISTSLANGLNKQYEDQGVVCPPALRKNLYTTAAVDNIDHNPSATTAKDSFHGTGISLFQCRNSQSTDSSLVVPVFDEKPCDTLTVKPLPESYSSVPAAVLITNEPALPERHYNVSHDPLNDTEVQKEFCWLKHVQTKAENTFDGSLNISWSGFHADQESDKDVLPSLTALLPLFEEQSKSVAMIRHSMNMIKASVDMLNPGQTPVIAFDQPLYAIAKQIQWNWPELYGEDKFVIMFGGLHIEMAAFKVLGEWLEASGWTHALTQADIASSGTADSFLKASHVTKTRRAHQLTACSLYILLQAAYSQYKLEYPDGDSLDFESWCAKMSMDKPQFQFWYLTLILELNVLTFIRSVREGDFSMYKAALEKLIPWFFALNHINYARWLPVHLRDMQMLPSLSPATEQNFREGMFVVHKTGNKFSGLAIDQAHEQNNALVKSDGGAVGLTENPGALRRWMVAGPEMSRLSQDFENLYLHTSETTDSHHEQKKGLQRTFHQHVVSLVVSLDELGNPFTEQSDDLISLDTKDIADPSVVQTLREVEKTGQEMYATFVEERLIQREKKVFDPIKKNSISLFRTPVDKPKQKDQSKISLLKNDCSLFSRLYISCQTRGGNIQEFFKHENQRSPPSLSQNGNIRLGNKAELLTKCLEPLSTVSEEAPLVEVLIIDGAALVNMLRPGTCQTFDEYASTVFLPYICSQLEAVKRIDVVWDVYVADSLKATARDKRGKGIRRRVEGRNSLPRDWQSFLRVDDNKAELFEFLANHIAGLQNTDKQIITTLRNEIMCNDSIQHPNLSPCSHEEADTRIMLHLADAAMSGYDRIMVRTVDTDVVALAVTYYHAVLASEIWIAFGTGKHFRYIGAHCVANALGPEKASVLSLFHAFTGCDTVSAFFGKGKKSAWDTWTAYNDLTDALAMMTDPAQAHQFDVFMPVLQRFVVVMYDRTSSAQTVDEARLLLFAQKGKQIENIPPTEAALLQHTKRTIYQGSLIWGNALEACPVLPSPAEFGWTKSNGKVWEPFWTMLPEAATSCQELVHCKCKKGCRGNCKCRRSALSCTALCACSGNCSS